MNEIARIKQLFADLFNGHPWLDVTIKDTLDNLTAEQAYRNVVTGGNTIWEIVNHIIAWRQNVLERVGGAVITTPEHNYFFPVQDCSDEAWEQTLIELNETQDQWLRFFDEFSEEDFEKIYPNNNMTYYQHIHGIIQHDAYHLGQIVLLVKAI